MNDEERLDERDYAELLKDVSLAKEKCRAFVKNDEDASSAEGKELKLARRLHHKLGGAEGRYNAMILASLDGDGDGYITRSELHKFENVAQHYCASTTTQLMNVAIVAALVMSFVVPTITSVLEIAPKSAEFFKGAIDYLEVIHHVLAIFTLALAGLTIFVVLRITTQIEWIMTSYGKLKYLTSGLGDTGFNVAQIMAVSQMLMLDALQFFILIRVAICCSPAAGLISLIFFISIYYQLKVYLCDKLLAGSAAGIAKKENKVLVNKMKAN